jgi:hypothetical protein
LWFRIRELVPGRGWKKVLSDDVIASFKDAARKLTGPNRRAFQAQVTLDYLDGSMGKAERVFGWSHHTVALGLNELRTGIICQGNFSARGNHKTETKSPELEADIRIRGRCDTKLRMYLL